MMSISDYFGDWTQVIDLEMVKGIVNRLKPYGNVLCPSLKDVFKAFKLCPLHKVRCVIMGQDPYCNYIDGHPVATGVAFANAKDFGEKSYSPSLEILMESVIDFSVPHNKIIFDPSLEEWEKQGVLMLNTALSCIKGKTGCHTLLWRPFITSLMTHMSECMPGVVYMLMGSQAQTLRGYINSNQHVLTCRHPSSYSRTHTKMPSELWSKANSILTGMNGYGITWYDEVKL